MDPDAREPAAARDQPGAPDQPGAREPADALDGPGGRDRGGYREHPEDRARRLQADTRRLAAGIAVTAEQSARVHDEVAEVHEGLGDRSRLDPAALCSQAARDREFAASERAFSEGGEPD